MLFPPLDKPSHRFCDACRIAPVPKDRYLRFREGDNPDLMLLTLTARVP